MALGEAIAVHVIGDVIGEVGEGPFWDQTRCRLWWVDLLAGMIHCSEVISGETDTFFTGAPVGAVVPRTRGGLVIANRTGFAWLDASGELVDEIDFLPSSSRMNDAKCDPSGRFWAGSTEMNFTPGHGALHVLDNDGTVSTVLSGITLPNGLGWSPDGRRFYLVDSEERWLKSWEFEVATGHLTSCRTLVTFAGDSTPDGMCIDSEGALWVAIWGGSRIERYSPEGELIGTVPLPVAQPSSCTFGGKDLDTLFVTSAHRGLIDGSPTLDGSLLAVTSLGVQGLPGMTFRG